MRRGITLKKRYITGSPEESFEIGRELGETLEDGDIIALHGQLGAGKTVFAKGIAAGLGVEEEITSPTFTLLKEYDGRLILHHFDLYRIENGEELESFGFYDITGDGVCVIEWAERASLPCCINVHINALNPDKPDEREIIIESTEENL